VERITFFESLLAGVSTAHSVTLALLLLILNTLQSSAGAKDTFPDPIKSFTNPSRSPKVFSLFSIVQFPNSACTSTSSTYSNGTCLTSSECAAKSGSAQGNCAAGFGVCCIFSVYASASTISENLTYIVNPSYPSNYVPSSTPTTLTYTINKCSSDICRIRLDYDLFVLTAPLTAQATQGQCSTDYMTLATTAQTVVPTSTTYGQYPYLCGTNTGYHSYIDLSPTETDTGTISFTVGDSTSNQWKIKVSQFSCDDEYVAAQVGCFQYFTGLTGTIQSYNYAGLAQIKGMNYKNCIRAEEGYCCIQYDVVAYAVDAVTCADATANRCAGSTTCVSDYIIVPGTVFTGAATATYTYDRFCGVNLHPEGTPTANVPIVSCDQPFQLSHVTNIEAVGTPGAAVTEDGFQITYKQLAGNC